jgi:hypothetical protein
VSHPEPKNRLGSRGVERREELLGQLRPIVRRRGWRRVGVRVVTVGIVAAVFVGAVAVMLKPSSTSVPGPPAFATADAPAQPTTLLVPARPAEPSVKVEVVATVPGLTERLSRVSQSVHAASDEDLMAALRASGQDPGIVRVDGRVVSVGGVWAK